MRVAVRSDKGPRVARIFAQLLALVWLLASSFATASALVEIVEQRFLAHGHLHLAVRALNGGLLEAAGRTALGAPLAAAIAFLTARWMSRWRASSRPTKTRLLFLALAATSAGAAVELANRVTQTTLAFAPLGARVTLAIALALVVAALLGLRSEPSREALRSAVARFVASRPIIPAAGVLAAVALLGTLAVAVEARFHRPQGPNVLLVVIDTLRADHVGAWGYGRETTPALDALARTAHRFDRAVATAPWTSPSVAGMLVSRYPMELGAGAWVIELARAHAHLAESFSDRHYRTGGVVSNPFLTLNGFAQGFDSYDQGDARGHEHVSSPSVTDKAIRFLRANQDRPHFLLVHYMDPHYDYFLHPPWDFGGGYQGPVRSGRDWDELRALGPSLSAADFAQLRALYDSEIRFTDCHLERLLGAMKELGLYEKTLIVVVSDHGESFGDRGRGELGHGETLEPEQLHVPLLIKLPGQRAEVEHDELVSLIDLAPTIAAAAGLPSPASGWWRGHPLLEERGRRPVFAELPTKAGSLQSVSDGEWKLVRSTRTREVALYDIAHDPYERLNLASAAPDKAAELGALLDRFDEVVNAPGKPGAQPAELTEEQERALRSLGYLR